MQVKATKVGFYENRRRYIGDTFTLANDKAFSSSWMKKLDTFKEVNADESKEKDSKKAESPTVVEPKEAGEESPAEQAKENGAIDDVGTNSSDKVSEKEGNKSDYESNKSSGEVEKISENALKKLKKDDLITKAIELGLSNNIDLTQLTNVQIVNLILESYEQKEANNEYKSSN